MATVTKAVLKTYFEQGDIPTQAQYVDLIDSQFGLGEAGTTQIIEGTISASAARVEFLELKKLYIPGLGISSHVDVANRTGVKVGSTFTVGKTLEVVGDINTTGIISGSNLVSSGHITASGTISASSGIKAGGGDLTGHVYIGSHLGEKNLYIDKYSNAFPYASIFSGRDDNNTKVGIKFVTRNNDGTAQDALVIEGDTREATFSNVVNATAINTGHGDFEIGQDTLTTSNVTFNNINTNGAITAGGVLGASSQLLIALQNTYNIIWASHPSATTAVAGGKFTITFSNLPIIEKKLHFSGEGMNFAHAKITEDSVLLATMSTPGNQIGAQIGVQAVVYGPGKFRVKLFHASEAATDLSAGGIIKVNFTHL